VVVEMQNVFRVTVQIANETQTPTGEIITEYSSRKLAVAA
jgi:hypothetical protein